MTTTIEITESLQDGFIKALETSQRLTLEAFGAGTASLKETLPTPPTAPFSGALPTAGELVDATFGFAEKIMKSQKAFVAEMIERAESVAPPAKKS
jgi:hypothetical protein